MNKQRVLLGQYYPLNSPIHRLDARAKLIITLLFMVSLFVANDWPSWAVLFTIAIIAVIISRVPFRLILSGMRFVLVFAALLLVMNIFIYPGTPFLTMGSVTLTIEGVFHGLAMGLRLIFLVVFAGLLTFTTTPIELSDGLEKLLKPLRIIRVPAHEIAMMMSIAMRMIPVLFAEFERIMLAQRARGAAINRGKLVGRLKSFIPVLIPLFVSAFRRAEEMAIAMDARCYKGGEGRTTWRSYRWRASDTIVLLLFFVLLAAIIVYRNLV